jgi:hypothetical protein
VRMKDDRTASALCPMAGFGISSAESSVREVVTDIQQYMHCSIIFYYYISK